MGGRGGGATAGAAGKCLGIGWKLWGYCAAILEKFFFFVSAHLNVTNQMATKRAQKNAG